MLFRHAYFVIPSRYFNIMTNSYKYLYWNDGNKLGEYNIMRNKGDIHQQTYLRLCIHTTQQFKCLRYPLTTLNISQLQTSIYLPKTARHTLQNSGTAIQHYIREGGVIWCCVYVGALVILKILNT